MGSFSGALGSLWVEVGAKISQFESAMASVGKTIDNTLKDAEAKFRGFEQLGSIMTGIGSSLTQSLTLPLVGLGIAATKMQGDFEHAMNKISALGDITGKDLEMLEAQAVDLGAKTQFSGTQAAQGMAELAASGQSAQQIFSSMPGVLNLAAAGEVSIAQAAKIATDAITQFGLSVSDSAHVADVLAQSAASGKDSVQGVGIALGYVGSNAHAAGLSMEQTTAALTLLADGGKRGSEAGTALNAILIRLVKPTKQAADALGELGISTSDTQGKLLPLSGILDQLKDKNLSLADAAKIAGVEHAGALVTLAQAGGGALNKLATEFQKASEATGGFSGAADKMAQTINKGIGGSLERMKGSIETAGQSLGKILEPAIISISGFIEKAANALSGFAQFFSQLPEPIQAAAGAFVILAAAAGPVLLVLGSLISAVGLVGSAFATLGAGGGITAAVVGFTALASEAVPAAIAAIGTFATVTLPAAIAAIGEMSIALLTGAATSLTSFATTAVPSAIAAVTTFATVTLPAAIAAVLEFATAGIPAAIQSVTTFATTAIPSAIAGLQTMAASALPAATGAIAALGVAAAVAAAAFAGWQLGKWAYDQIPGVKSLGDSISGLLLKIPGVEAALLKLTGASAQTSTANTQLDFATNKLKESLSKHGVVVSGVGQSTEQYAAKLRDAAKAFDPKAISSQTKAHTSLGKQVAVSAKALSDHSTKSTESASSAKQAASDFKPLIDRTNELWQTSEKLTEQHRKAIAAIVDWKLAHQDAASVVPKLTQVSDDLDVSINQIIKDSAPLGDITSSAFLKIFDAASQARQPLDELAAAYKQLQITSTAALTQQAADAYAAFETIRDSGVASAADIASAWDKAMKVQAAASDAGWKSIREEQSSALDDMQQEASDAQDAMAETVTAGHAKQASAWEGFSNEVSTIVTNLSQDIARSLFEGGGSWAEKGINALKRIGEAAVSQFIEPFAKAAADLISGALADLMGGKGLGGLLSRFKEVGSSIGGIFGGGGGGGAAGAVTGATGTGGGGGAAGAAGAGIAGIAGAVGSIAGAVSGIIGNFQNAKQETSLNAIEHNTRYAMMFLGERGDGGIVTASLKSAEYLAYLNTSVDTIGKYLSDWLSPANNALQDIMSNVRGTSARLNEISTNTYWGSQADKDNSLLLSTLRDLLTATRSVTPTITVYVNGVQAPDSSVSLRMQGALI